MSHIAAPVLSALPADWRNALLLGSFSGFHFRSINPKSDIGDAMGESSHQPHFALLVRAQLATRTLGLENSPASRHITP